MNRKTMLLLVGLIIGGAIGFFTAPRPAVDIDIGGVNIQVQGDQGGGLVSATGEGNGDAVQVQVGQPSPLSQPGWRALIFAVIGAAIGYAAGIASERRGT
jgi:hypothetical protein